MLLFATALTRYPGESREAHVRSLRDAGLDDGEILDATLVIAYFNFVNRIALGLGVEFTDDEVSGYKV